MSHRCRCDCRTVPTFRDAFTMPGRVIELWSCSEHRDERVAATTDLGFVRTLTMQLVTT